MKKFNTDYHIPTVSLLWLVVVFLAVVPFITPNDIEGDLYIPIIICILSALLIVWILLGTGYRIEGSYLKYKSGPLKGKIDIFRIHTIEHQKGWMVSTNIKPALGTKGLIIKYNKYDDIYISPKKKQEFIDTLLEINSHIEIR